MSQSAPVVRHADGMRAALLSTAWTMVAALGEHEGTGPRGSV